MHPILFQIGTFEIPSYGAVLALTFLLCVFLLKREAIRLGMNGNKASDTAIVGLLTGLMGAKLLLILIDLPTYLANPGEILATLRSAGVIYGGQIGGALGIIWYSRKHRLPLWDTLDLFTPFLALGMGLGRLGCFLSGCCYGIPYEGVFALHFPDHPRCQAPADIGLFPIQLLDLLSGLVLFAILLTLLRQRRFKGQVFFAFMMLYGLARSLVELLRGDFEERGMWLGGAISTSQLIAILAVAVGAILYRWKGKSVKSGSVRK